MLSKMGVTFATVFLATATTAAAGVFEIEIPADLAREDVLNPTPAVTARLNALFRDEVAKHPAEANCAPSAFTKDGEIIYADVEREATDDWSDNRLTFIPADTAENRFLWPEFEGSWDAAVWHLHEAGQPEKDGVAGLAEDMFGYPFRNGTVYVEWDPTITVEGNYNVSTQTIYIKNWRDWQDERYKTEPNNPNWNDDAAVLTRCMLQAWHHAWPALWDHFASMGCAAWIAIHNWLGDRGYELGFNDLYHDDQRVDRPYYKCLDNYNTEELASRLNNWAHHEHSPIYDDIKYWRYGAAGFCWWKVYRKQFGFMWCFNQKQYDWLVNHFFQRPEEYGDYKKFAVDGFSGDAIEGRDFLEWFDHQPILRNDGWCDDFCALAVDRTTARVLAYRRYTDGVTGEEKEVAHYPAGVVIEKKDWQGGPLGSQGVDVNSGGYGEWDFPIHYPNEGIRVTARLNLGGGDITDSRWAIDSDAAYEADALYGVVKDAVGGGGSVTIKKGGVEQATVPVFRKAFRWTPAGPPGPGEYELVYNPPRGSGGRSYTPHRVLKDVASYFSEANYVADVWAEDADGNGIPDSDETVLAAKFSPKMNIHTVNRLMPQTTDISLDTGYYGRWTGDPLDPWDWIQPGPGETMRDVIESFEFYYDKDFISFGTKDRGINQDEYWPQQYDKLVEEYDKPYVYYNIFKYRGKPVIQFWFYYPYNSWRNDHEGDWEHINVRISSPYPARAFLDEVVFYFHEKRATLNGNDPWLEIVDDSHPVIYVGGEPVDADYDFSHETSGGSYWRAGQFEYVAFDTHENIVFDPGKVIHYNNFEKVWAGKCTQNPYWWWLMFPGLWGRPGVCLHDFAIVKGDGIPSPWHHECWQAYQHPDYPEYGSDRGLASAAPPFAGPEPFPSSEAALFESPFASLALSPIIGEYQSPSAGKYLSPVASSPGGADTPGDDSAPPLAATPAAFGGDSVSGRAVAAGFGRGGPLAAASAEPLSCSPNPVSCAATITFKVEAPCRVNLAIYDISGRRVATLADGPYAVGEHSASWQADVPAGVYIYRLQAGDDVAVKKLVVAR